MRVSDASLLGVMGLAAAAVLVATAGGLFADPPLADPRASAWQPAQAPATALVAAPAAATAPQPVAGVPVPEPLLRAAPPAPVQREWLAPEHAELKAARPPADTADLPLPAPVFTPGEQQAAWAARDKLANAGRAARPAAPAVLTRPHEGPAPDKTAADR